MAQLTASLTCEISIGPTFWRCMEAARLARKVVQSAPYTPDRAELEKMLDGVVDDLEAEVLTVRSK